MIEAWLGFAAAARPLLPVLILLGLTALGELSDP